MTDNLINTRIGKFVISYLIITYIIYLFLPTVGMHTEDMHEMYTIIFLTLCCISFYCGCRSVPIRKQYYFSKKSKFTLGNGTLAILISTFTIITFSYLGDMISSGVAQMSISMGDNYANMLENEMNFNSFWGQLYTLLSPFRVLLVTYCIVFFKSLTKFNFILLIGLLFSYLMLTISRGQFVGIGNVAVFISIPLLFKNWVEGNIGRFKKQILIIGVVFIALFIINQFARSESLGSDFASSYDNESVFFQIFGPKVGAGIIRLLSYFSHGYKGLNYSLQLPFEWTDGYGGSRALGGYMNQYFGLPTYFEATYPMRVLNAFGYDCQTSWPTAFAWWASDFSFPGVVVFMYFIGKLFCLVFRDACYYLDIVAISFLCELSILVFFMPMNNQAFQTRESLLITVFLFLAWIYRRKLRKI